MSDRLDGQGILIAWEAGVNRRPLDRALALLWAAGAAGPDEPADLPLVERDRRLLAIRARNFGAVMPSRATCPECGEELELELDANGLLAAVPAADCGDVPRAITSRDVAAIAGLDSEAAMTVLRERLAQGSDVAPAVLDPQIEAAAEAAELTTHLTCAACGAGWRESLDVPAYLWADIEVAALRLLSEVAEIAGAYGWSEAEILSLSPARRAAYLARVRA